MTKVTAATNPCGGFNNGPLALAGLTLLGVGTVAQETVGKGLYILAAGRRLPYVYAISLDAALNPANDRTSNAIVGRSKVAADRSRCSTSTTS